jgi:two-component system, sensor histidine kinase
MQTPSTRVLIADDKRGTAFALGKLLEAHGHSVRVVLNGLAAMDVLREFQPQVVLLDIGMPGMDGHQVTRQIRREFGFESMVIVIVSGHGEESDKERSKEAGANYHLTKPINFDDLWAIFSKTAQSSIER